MRFIIEINRLSPNSNYVISVIDDEYSYTLAYTEFNTEQEYPRLDAKLTYNNNNGAEFVANLEIYNVNLQIFNPKITIIDEQEQEIYSYVYYGGQDNYAYQDVDQNGIEVLYVSVMTSVTSSGSYKIKVSPEHGRKCYVEFGVELLI